ncbi:MAG: hypothetical protein ACLR0N_09940 [Bilophila wadsworthia]
MAASDAWSALVRILQLVLEGFGNTAAVPVWALCALTAALHGCGSSGR